MFAFSFGPQLYSAHKDGRALTLRDCLDACYGVGAARIWRINPGGSLSKVAENAGSATEITHHKTGRRIRRRRTRWAPTLTAYDYAYAARTGDRAWTTSSRRP